MKPPVGSGFERLTQDYSPDTFKKTSPWAEFFREGVGTHCLARKGFPQKPEQLVGCFELF
jgi:hypothetical protein